MQQDPRWVLERWDAALQAKYFGEGEAFGRKEFDEVLGDFDAVTDAPPCVFVDELTAAYPEAKVVLTTRDPDKWLASMRSTIFEVNAWRSYRILRPFDRDVLGPMYDVISDWCRGFCAGEDPMTTDIARRRFVEHYEHVRAVVPKDNLLEFESKDGWGPLCEFLGVPVPADGQAYPFINDGAYYVEGHKVLRNAVAWKAAKRVAGAVLPVLAVGAAVYFYGIRRSL
ncbi:MAG: hypothetical protein M4579_006312 [Chaenotheca gracillima]|nr:MAG: hypothetical protein M4579_006312 [Chaenotheca gracillima]